MSFSQSVTNSINNTVYSYIQNISTKFNIDESELQMLWDNGSFIQQKQNKSISKSVEKVTPITSDSELSKMLKPELISLCKAKGLKTTGTKQELIDRLSQQTESKVETKAELVQKTLTSTKVATAVGKKEVVSKAPVSKALVANTPQISIRRNQFGNYEHPETSFVFDRQNKKVIGKQNDNGKIEELTSEDIDICNQYKFDYVLPTNLNKKENMKDVKIDELDNEEVVEDDDIQEEMLIEDDDEEIEYEEEVEVDYE
jgi:hypothetical protein